MPAGLPGCGGAFMAAFMACIERVRQPPFHVGGFATRRGYQVMVATGLGLGLGLGLRLRDRDLPACPILGHS